MSTFKTKHFMMLTVALTMMALGNAVFAQQTTQPAHTMFLGEGVTKINMIEYKSNPTPLPLSGSLGGNNPTWEVSPFGKAISTTAAVNDVGSTAIRLSTLGKSSLKGQTLSFEIVSGAIDRCSTASTTLPVCLAPKSGEINHTGGLTLTRGGYPSTGSLTDGVSDVTGNFQRIRVKRIQVVGLTFDLSNGVVSGLVTTSNDWAEQHTGAVLGRENLFTIPSIKENLVDGQVSRSSRFDTLWVQDIKVELDPAMATTLNTFFGVTSFTANMHVGWANFFAVGVPPRELPDYRDWVFRY